MLFGEKLCSIELDVRYAVRWETMFHRVKCRLCCSMMNYVPSS